jgi:DHA3 family multidrug efflux protein-like MFS transporter
MIIGGLLVAKVGLGSRPVRTLLLANLVLWLVTALDTLQSSIVLITVGLFLSMALMPVAEAAEQTVLQKVVPLERQGRVFGFAQSVEQSASPLTAILVSPLAEFVTIPLMTTGAGADLVGGWYGTGPDRGLAVLMTVFGLAGALLTLLALRSRPFRRLETAYSGEPAPVPSGPVGVPVAGSLD